MYSITNTHECIHINMFRKRKDFFHATKAMKVVLNNLQVLVMYLKNSKRFPCT